MDSLVGDKVVMRTLVQLDGDVLTFVSASGQVAGWNQATSEQHWEKVQCTLKKVSSQLNRIIYSVTWAAAVVSFVIIAFSTLPDASPHSWDTWTWIFQVLANVALPIGIGSVAYVGFCRNHLAPVFLKAVRFWIGWHSSLARKEEVIAAKRSERGYPS